MQPLKNLSSMFLLIHSIQRDRVVYNPSISYPSLSRVHPSSPGLGAQETLEADILANQLLYATRQVIYLDLRPGMCLETSQTLSGCRHRGQ